MQDQCAVAEELQNCLVIHRFFHWAYILDLQYERTHPCRLTRSIVCVGVHDLPCGSRCLLMLPSLVEDVIDRFTGRVLAAALTERQPAWCMLRGSICELCTLFWRVIMLAIRNGRKPTPSHSQYSPPTPWCVP